MRRRTLILAGVLVLAIAISMVAAGASSVLNTGSLAATTSIISQNLSWGAGNTMTFDKFNVAGATLIGFSISLDGTLTSNMTMTNTSEGSINWYMSSAGALTLTDPTASTDVVTTLPTSDYSSSLYPAYGGTEPKLTATGSGKTFTATNVTASDTTSAVWYNAIDSSYMTGSVTADSYNSSDAVVADFSGPGTIVLDATGTYLTGAGATGSQSNSETGAAGATGSITYYYEETPSTPEVGTFGLMGLSMLPIVGVAIRRRKRS
jgi:hypothetical protein